MKYSILRDFENAVGSPIILLKLQTVDLDGTLKWVRTSVQPDEDIERVIERVNDSLIRSGFEPPEQREWDLVRDEVALSHTQEVVDQFKEATKNRFET